MTNWVALAKRPQQPFEALHQTQYQYDSLGRIQQEKSGTQRHTFYFDPASNLINDPTEKVINNRLSHYQGVRYTYDSLGNLTECQTANGDSQRYTYDLKHQLIRADIHNRYTTESWVYDYDPLGRRIAKSKLNKQGEKQCHTQFIWAGSHLVQEIRKGKNGAETDRTFTYIYTHPDSYEPLAQCYKESENAQHTVNYFHCDQIGIPREMTDSQGKLLWKGRYDAWGQLIHDSNRHAQRTTHQPFRLQNQYFDQETGLHYNFLRYYEPALGRFITQDPIGLMGGMNLYQFAANTQTIIDPMGLAATCPFRTSDVLKGMAMKSQADDIVKEAAKQAIEKPVSDAYLDPDFSLSTEVSADVAAAQSVDFSSGIAFSKTKGKWTPDFCGYITMCQGIGVDGGSKVGVQAIYSDSSMKSGVSYSNCVSATATGGIGGAISACVDPTTGGKSFGGGIGAGSKYGASVKQCMQITKCI